MLNVKNNKDNVVDVVLNLRLNLGESDVDDINITQTLDGLKSIDLVEDAHIIWINKVRL